MNLELLIKDAQGGLVSVLPPELFSHFETNQPVVEHSSGNASSPSPLLQVLIIYSEQNIELKDCASVFEENKWKVTVTLFGVGTVCLTASDASEKLAPGFCLFILICLCLCLCLFVFCFLCSSS